jgi:hypothetical protein
MEITHSKINVVSVLTGVSGALLAFLGIVYPQLYPWVTFKTDHFLLPRYRTGEIFWEWVYYQLSPFLLKYRSETSTTVTTWFYRTNMTVTGAICLIGIALSVASIFFKNRKTTVGGGVIIIISMILFSTSLPGVYPSFSWGLGAKFTFFGALIIVLSAVLGIMIDNDERNRYEVRTLLNTWKNVEKKRK